MIRFLSKIAEDAEQIYIVGDLFDYWFEYIHVVPKGYVRLLGKLAELTDNGIEITYIAGNHDFWLNNYFKDELGIFVHHHPIERSINGKRFYLHHGDGLLKIDWGYNILKRFLTNRINIRLFSILHPDVATGISRWFSKQSRHRSSALEYNEKDIIEFATNKIKEGFDYVVMGHSHRTGSKKIEDGFYINLGEWMRMNSYAVYDGERIIIEYFSA